MHTLQYYDLRSRRSTLITGGGHTQMETERQGGYECGWNMEVQRFEEKRRNTSADKENGTIERWKGMNWDQYKIAHQNRNISKYIHDKSFLPSIIFSHHVVCLFDSREKSKIFSTAIRILSANLLRDWQPGNPRCPPHQGKSKAWGQPADDVHGALLAAGDGAGTQAGPLVKTRKELWGKMTAV